MNPATREKLAADRQWQILQAEVMQRQKVSARNAQLHAMDDYRRKLSAEYMLARSRSEVRRAVGEIVSFKNSQVATGKGLDEIYLSSLTETQKFVLVAVNFFGTLEQARGRKSIIEQPVFFELISLSLMALQEHIARPSRRQMLKALFGTRETLAAPMSTVDDVQTFADLDRWSSELVRHPDCVAMWKPVHPVQGDEIEVVRRPVFKSATLWMELQAATYLSPKGSLGWEIWQIAGLLFFGVMLVADFYVTIGFLFEKSLLVFPMVFRVIEDSVSIRQTNSNLSQYHMTGEADEADRNFEEELPSFLRTSIAAADLILVFADMKHIQSKLRKLSNRSVLSQEFPYWESLATSGIDLKTFGKFLNVNITLANYYKNFRLTKNLLSQARSEELYFGVPQLTYASPPEPNNSARYWDSSIKAAAWLKPRVQSLPRKSKEEQK